MPCKVAENEFLVDEIVKLRNSLPKGHKGQTKCNTAITTIKNITFIIQNETMIQHEPGISKSIANKIKSALIRANKYQKFEKSGNIYHYNIKTNDKYNNNNIDRNRKLNYNNQS